MAAGPFDGGDEEEEVMRDVAARRSPADEFGDKVLQPFVGPLFTTLLFG